VAAAAFVAGNLTWEHAAARVTDRLRRLS
jgi:hypothetical protein